MYTKDVKRETAIKILLSGLLFFLVLTSQSCSSSNWSVPSAASNLSPAVVITSPFAGNISDEGTNVTFTGSANDPEDGALSGASLVWTSDRDGQIGIGLTFDITTLSRGVHVITLTAADESGGQGTAVMTITVRTPWFGSQWGCRQQITISASMAPLDQTDFPALIQITDQNNPLFDNAQAGGDDILFTDLDGVNQLDHEIELYSSTGTEELDAWVRINLSSTSDTILYMYYGNGGAANQENVNAVWSNDFIMVQHLNESPANGVAGHIDSAPITDPKKVPYNFIPQNFDGVVGTTDAAGKIAGADYFAGDDDFLASDPTFYGSDQFRNVYFVDHWSNVPADPDRNGTWTFSAWVQTPTAGRAVFSEGNNAAVAWNRVRLDASGQFDSNGLNNSWTPTHGITSNATGLNDNTWKYLVMAYDNGDLDMYINGSFDQNSFLAPLGNISIYHSAIGSWRRYYSGAWRNYSFWEGLIDEVRASKINRSADWILTEYNNQDNPAGFLTFGTEEVL